MDVIFGQFGGIPFYSMIALAMSLTEKPDLILYKERRVDYQYQVCKLKETNLFHNIYILDSDADMELSSRISETILKGGKIRSIIGRVWLYTWRGCSILFPKYFIKKLVKDEALLQSKYEHFFVAGTNGWVQLLYSYWVMKDMRPTVIELGHAIDIYMEDKPHLLQYMNVPKRIFTCIFADKLLDCNISEQYLISPKLALREDVKIPKEIELPSDYNMYRAIVNRTSGSKIPDATIMNYKFMYVESDLSYNKLIIERIVNIVGQSNFILKAHPSGYEKLFDGEVHREYRVLKHNFPFEQLAVNFNIENNVFITSFSSCLFSPKILANQEPYIIITILIEENVKDYSAQMIDTFLRYIEHYRKNVIYPGKVYIPKSMDELELILNDLMTRYSL